MTGILPLEEEWSMKMPKMNVTSDEELIIETENISIINKATRKEETSICEVWNLVKIVWHPYLLFSGLL